MCGAFLLNRPPRRLLSPGPLASRAQPGLVLGQLLRHVGRTEATVWVETDTACQVQVLESSTRTFEVRGHHYALVCLDDLPEGTVLEYEVPLDGERVWPPGGDHPPSTIHT